MRAWRVATPLSGVVLAAALWPATSSLSELAREGSLGPGFWPRLALLGLGLACLAKAVEAWRRVRAPNHTAGDTPESFSRARLLGGVTLIVAYTALTPAVGFPLATAAFIVAFMALAGARSPAGLAASALVGAVVLVYVFVKVVYLPLPKGDGPFEALTLALYRALGIF